MAVGCPAWLANVGLLVASCFFLCNATGKAAIVSAVAVLAGLSSFYFQDASFRFQALGGFWCWLGSMAIMGLASGVLYFCGRVSKVTATEPLLVQGGEGPIQREAKFPPEGRPA